MFADISDIWDVATAGYVLVIVAFMTAGAIEFFKIFRGRK